MKKDIILKALITLVISIVGNAFIYAQTFGYKSHTNANIANYSMPYRLFVPSGYDTNTSYPLVLFLHGAGERGTDNNAHIESSRGAKLWAESANQASYPCFVVAPQCPANKQWVNTNWSNGSYSITNVAMSTELKMVKDIIETLQNQYNIDASRLYITGLSMGGYGTWDFILRYPEMFKAAIPICGAGDPSKASLISTIPLRVFHSSDDGVVPVAGSRDMVNAINALGPNTRTKFYTEYNNQGHFSWTNAYNTADLVSWLFTTAPIILNCNNTLTPVVSIEPGSVNSSVNSYVQLTANVTPNDICNKAVVWTSSNPAIVAVDQTGRILCKNGGTATITATSVQGGVNATCQVNVDGVGLNEVYVQGTAYRWSQNVNSTSNANRVLAPGLNDGDISTDVSLNGGSEEQISNVYEAAGLIFSTAKTITKVEFINGTFAGILPNGYMDDGCFDDDFKLQISVDGTTWTNATEWTHSPAYEYMSTSVSGATFTFTGSSANILGIRVTGKVRISETTGSWEARVREIIAYSDGFSNITNTQQKSNIFLHLNPAKTDLTISNIPPNSVIKVVSIDGRNVSESTAESETVKFDVSLWAKGVYVFHFKTGLEEITRKVVIN